MECRIHTVRPKGICYFCGDAKANRRVDVMATHMRGDDDVFKAHAKCIKNIGYENILFALGYEDEYGNPLSTQSEEK